MKTKSSIFGVVVLLVLLLHGCIAKKTNVMEAIFERKYSCDSIIFPTYNFIFEDDSAIYSPIKKEPFDFKLQITRDFIRINKERYYYFLGGLNIDTLGLVNITGDVYLYRHHKGSDQSVVLFNFHKVLQESWLIKDDGYFNDYEVVLEDINYNKAINDTVYTFSYTFLGQKFPNGYYFKNFDVSKQYGILSFNFTNGVECNCIIE
jgi:hypothetical protein